MNGETLMIGRVNAGKTSLCLRLARHLGLRELNWVVERTDGMREKRRMLLSEADSMLASDEAHQTREMQTLLLSVPRGKQDRMVRVTDSAGLADGLYHDTEVRHAMAQTLRGLLTARGVFHVVDAAALGHEVMRTSRPKDVQLLHPLDQQIYMLGHQRGAYVIVANKMDLPMAKEGYRFLRSCLDKARVIPVSAKSGNGFDEVKRYVWRMA